MERLTFDEMVTAMQADDVRYDGLFYVCVRSTGIYCLPSCKAKLPLIKNVLFVRTREEAIESGFRGCKRCRSEYYPDTSPLWLNTMLVFMKQKVQSKIRERDLSVAVGVDISTIRRYFKVCMNTTPMAYHRQMRLEYARSLLAQGTDYLTAAYECGFESASGFRDAFIKQYGHLPGRVDGF